MPVPLARPPPSGPPRVSTTAYVGKIAPSLTAEFARQLIEACGPLKSWKPMQDPETKKLKGFGFAEFEDAEGTMRCLRVLNGLEVEGSPLLVKVDEATQAFLDYFVRERRRKAHEAAAAHPEAEEGGAEAPPPPPEAAEGEGAPPPPLPPPHAFPPAETAFSEEPTEAEVQQMQQGDREARARVEALLASRPGYQAVVSRFVESVAAGAGAAPSPVPADRDREKDRPSRRSRSRSRDRERDREQDRERDREEREYQARRRDWERQEDDRRRAREKEEARARDAERDRERQLRADNETGDSDEELEPWQRRPLKDQRRMEGRRRARAREEQEDAVDRERERAEAQRRRELEERLAREAAAQAIAASAPAVDPTDPVLQAMMREAAGAAGAGLVRLGGAKKPGRVAAAFAEDEEEDAPRRRLLPLPPSMAALEGGGSARGTPGPESLARPAQPAMADVMSLIPTDWSGVRAYAIDWPVFDTLRREGLEETMRKWVGKKVAELLGTEEPMMTDFIIAKVVERSAPQALFDEIHEVLDVETEGFLLKLYRMVIYEVEKRKIALGAMR